MPPLMAVALLIFGLVFVVAFQGDFRTALRSNRHLKTQGTLRSSWIEQHGELNSNREFFTPMVIFDFTVAGKKYVGKQLRIPTRSLRSWPEAEEALSPYVTGSPLDVWYDPEAPHICYLRKTHTAEAALPVIFGGILVVCSLFGLVSAH